MRKGVRAACVLATSLGLIATGCGGKHKAVPSSGGYAQPTSAAPESSPPSTGAPESSPPSTMGPESSPPVSSASPSAGPMELKAKDVSIGKIVVDGRDMTVYLFEKDKGGKSACTGACASLWPPLITSDGKVTAGSGVNASWISTADREDGTKQVTYHGWPLYYYAKDTKPGDMNGQGLNSFGGPWYVVDAVKGEKLEKK
jgi:predicted lipoprotein with Yx(FWY)xxD motif